MKTKTVEVVSTYPVYYAKGTGQVLDRFLSLSLGVRTGHGKPGSQEIYEFHFPGLESYGIFKIVGTGKSWKISKIFRVD